MSMRRIGGWTCGLALAGLALGPPARGAVNGVELPPPPLTAPALERDVRLTFQARRALEADKALAPLNLSVQVRGGVATLWGPVPSAEEARRVVRKVTELEGVTGVRSELYVSDALNRRELLVFPVLPQRPPQRTEAALPDRESWALKLSTQDTASRRDADGPGEGLPPLAPARRAEAKVVTKVAVPVVAPRSPVLLAPVPFDERSLVRVDRRVPSQPVQRAAPKNVAAEVERVRQMDARFQLVRVDVRGGVVVVFPGEARGEDAMALAAAIRRVPGVMEVLVDD